MILKGSQRSGAKQLSQHLLNKRDNDHVQVLEVRGFIADDLTGALQEAYAVSKATKCKQFLFSLSVNPPADQVLGEQEFIDAVNRAEKVLGLEDQPRAIVIHEKENRRHCHCAWSRVQADTLTAINLPHFKNKLRDLSRDLFLDHGWTLPKGLQANQGKNPMNFTLAEWQQAKRQGVDPREIKQVMLDAWERSDNVSAFAGALEERGYFLACGDRRGFVLTDYNGDVYSLSRWLGMKKKDLQAKLGPANQLSSLSDVRGELRRNISEQLKGFIHDVKARQKNETAPLIEERQSLTLQHRREREHLKSKQDERWQDETKARNERLNKGLRGFFDRLSGKSRQTIKRNEMEAVQSARRDQKQRDSLVVAQMSERKSLQQQFSKLRSKHAQDRKILAREVMHSLRRFRLAENNNKRGINRAQEPPAKSDRRRGPNLSL